MDQKKINNLIIASIASCFYSFIIYLLLELLGFKLMDSAFMMSLYTVVFAVVIYNFLYDKINKILKNKIIIIIIISLPIILFFISLFSQASKMNNNDKIDDNILEEGLNIYESSDQILGNEDFNIDEYTEDVIYKIYGDYIIKKDKDGKVYQFKPINQQELKECVYKVYELKEGYILACTTNENLNYYSKEAKDYSVYYKLNVPEEYLSNLNGFEVEKLDTSDEKTYTKYTIDGVIYYTAQTYSNINLYKQFNEEQYLYIHSFDLKSEVEKTYKIRSWYEQIHKLTFITNDFDRYEVTFELKDDLTLKANYKKQ